jgi:aryl-alcohol dehydrogenase-like predicted oxidoreductase
VNIFVKSSLFPNASRIGFGCASLGSRISAKAGLAALSRAFTSGVNWFDLAPSYGDGQAEEIFSSFCRGRRADLHILTKCGMAAPAIGTLARAMRPLARTLYPYAPRGVRNALARGRPVATYVPLSGEMILTSLHKSLRQLHTDYVDVLALHDPHPNDLARDDIRSAIERIVASGRARVVGIAGSLPAAEAGLRMGLPIHHIQIGNNALEPQMDAIARLFGRRLESMFITTHSVFGPPNLVRSLVSAVQTDPKLERTLQRLGFEMPIEEAVRSALIDYAFRSNPAGTVLFSMFTADNLTFNLRRAKMRSSPDPQPFFNEIRAKFSNSHDDDDHRRVG